MFIPVHLFLFGIAFPLGWLTQPGYEHLIALAKSPLARVYLFVLCSLPLFHWAHRFRFTVYDGLQVKHLNEVILIFCYGGAVLGTLLSLKHELRVMLPRREGSIVNVSSTFGRAGGVGASV